MCRLQLNLNPSNWLVLEYLGLLNGETTTPSTSTTTTPSTTNAPPPSTNLLTTAKKNLEIDIKTRLDIIRNLFGVIDVNQITTDFNTWDKGNSQHLRGKDWETLLKEVDKDTGKTNGDDTNFADTKSNITAGTTEYFIATIKKGQFGVVPIKTHEKKDAVEAYMKKYNSPADNACYNDARYKTWIQGMGLAVPPSPTP